ncbi:hypothetical protein [Desulfatitalea alkaliphila]|uniref:Motility protein n=1 Tax=Desulfatitalea alkaliphila TaxID=2929485 RepID=A0AA41R0T5_9BACT|nr:hypothetical protein [Desulfatitalea alkaliphila]MCJ8499120.1 hypothetical protein [Desulfatitalea alkaliphila]
MEIAPIATDAAMLSIVRQMETATALQTEVMKTMAEGQQEMADMLYTLGVGENVDVRA